MTEPVPPRKGGGDIRPRGTRYAVRAVVDGRELELKEFLHDLIGGAVAGMLGGLRDVDAPKSITLDVEKL